MGKEETTLMRLFKLNGEIVFWVGDAIYSVFGNNYVTPFFSGINKPCIEPLTEKELEEVMVASINEKNGTPIKPLGDDIKNSLYAVKMLKELLVDDLLKNPEGKIKGFVYDVTEDSMIINGR